MPYHQYLTASTYDNTLGSFTSSSSASTIAATTFTEAGNHPAANGVDDYYESYTHVMSGSFSGQSTYKPFMNGGEYTISEGVTKVITRTQKLKQGQTPSPLYGTYKTLRVTKKDKNGSSATEQYTHPIASIQRASSTESFRLGKSYTRKFLRVNQVEYKSDGFTTSTRGFQDLTSKGKIDYYLTTQGIVLRNARGVTVNGTTYQTSSSFNDSAKQTVVIHKDPETAGWTTTFEHGRKEIIDINTSGGTTSVPYETVTLTTRYGNTALHFQELEVPSDKVPMLVVKVEDYSKSDSNNDAFKDTVYILTKHTYNSAKMLSWYSDENAPSDFTEVTDSYVVTDTYYSTTIGATNTKEQPFLNTILLSHSTTKNSTGDPFVINYYAGSVGPKDSDNKLTDISTSVSKRNQLGSSGTFQSKTGIVYEFGEQSVFNENARLYQDVGGESNEFGGFRKQFSTTSNEVTIQSSTILDQFTPFDSSMHYAKEIEGGDMVWRGTDEGFGVQLSSTSIASTVVESSSLEFQNSPNPTDTEVLFVPEVTSEKRYYRAETYGANIPMFAQILPTTQTAQQVVLGKEQYEANPDIRFDKTIRVFDDPETISITLGTGKQTTETAYLKFTGTRQTKVSELMALQKVTTAVSVESTKSDVGQTTRLHWLTHYETTEPEIWYANGISSEGQSREITFSYGSDFNEHKILTNTWKTIRRTLSADKVEKGGSSFSGTTIGRSRKVNYLDGKTPLDLGSSKLSYQQVPKDYTQKAKRSQSVSVTSESFYDNVQRARAGTLDNPYIICFTGSTGRHGYVWQSTIRSTGTGQNDWYGDPATELTYSKLAYFGAEKEDYLPYQNALRLTTMDWRFGANNETLMSILRGGIITTTFITDITRSYYSTYEHTIDMDVEGWIEFCLSDYSDNTAIYDLNLALPNAYFNSNSCYEIIYMDECGNSKVGSGGMGLGGTNATNSVMNTNLGLQSYSIDDGQGNILRFDQYGNPWNPANNQNQQQPSKRDPSCGPFTWSYISTYFEPHFTLRTKSSTSESVFLEGRDIQPPYGGMQTYYGDLHYPELLQTTADIYRAEHGWFNPAVDSAKIFHGDWVNQIFNFNVGYIMPLFKGNQFIDKHGRDIIRNQFITQVPEGYLDLEENKEMPLNLRSSPVRNHYNMIETEHFIQPYIRSQNLYSMTTHCENYNAYLHPFWATELGASADNSELYINFPEYRTNWIDQRRNNRKLVLQTKTFQVGAFAIGHTRVAKTTSFENVVIMQGERLGAEFTSDSKFLKKYLENTHYTLTSQNLKGDLTDIWYYKTSSQKISTIESGNDGVWRHSVESAESGTQPFTLQSETIDAKTILNGNFILGNEDPTYYSPNNQFFPTVKPDCCDCRTYKTSGDESKWIVGVSDSDMSTQLGGQWRYKGEKVIGGHMTCAFLPVAQHVDSLSPQVSALPLRLWKKDLSDKTWTDSKITVDYTPTGNVINSLTNQMISYEVPYMFLAHANRPYGVSITNKLFTVDFYIFRQKPCIYDEYERIGAMINVKDEWLNRHMHFSLIDKGLEGDTRNWTAVGNPMIEKRIRRNQNFPLVSERLDDYFVRINNTEDNRPRRLFSNDNATVVGGSVIEQFNGLGFTIDQLLGTDYSRYIQYSGRT